MRTPAAELWLAARSIIAVLVVFASMAAGLVIAGSLAHATMPAVEAVPASAGIVYWTAHAANVALLAAAFFAVAGAGTHWAGYVAEPVKRS